MIANEDTPRIDRRGARGIVADERDHVLFIGRPAAPGRPAHWILPGGGIDPGESMLDAARRELYEETGLLVHAADLLGPVAWQLFHGTRASAPFIQQNHFFFTRAPRFEPRVCGGDAYEQDLEFTWIAVGDISATDGLRRTEPLQSLIKRLLGGEVPGEPVALPPTGRPHAARLGSETR